jgi:outer membrane receptor protein involved in Fe transport
VRTILSTAALSAAAIALMAGEAAAQSVAASPDEIFVYGRALSLIGEAGAGSEGVVGYDDFKRRPLLRAGELVEVIPGLVATQHSGTGKANQFFLRGFNLDHGTDFAASFDGAPVNMRTHGHGQGYLDLNFIIPEIIERVDYRKGPYRASDSDFSAAGSAAFSTYDALDETIAQATIGENGYRRGLIAGSAAVLGGDLLLAGEAVFSDGAFVLDEELEKFNAFAKYSRATAAGGWSLSASAYDARWTSTDQVPLRAIESGLIPRLGFIDPDLGGEASRYALTGAVDAGDLDLTAYAIYSDFTLFSNFTYFLDDPVNGDEFEQRDERVVAGGAARYATAAALFGREADVRLGADIRYDDIFTIGLFNTAARERLNTVRDDDVREFSGSVHGEVEIPLTPRLRATVGLRGDLYAYDVQSSLAVNSGDGTDGLVSPKAALAWRATDSLELYANYGRGFHSNDVRGAAISVDPVTLDPADPVDVLVKADGAEIGARFERGGLTASLVGFFLDLDSELVFVGDAGTTEPNGATRRYGLEASAFWRPAPFIALDVSAAYTDARFKDAPPGARRIPQAVEHVIAAGASVTPIEDVTATIRVRHFGEAPLIEDGSAFSDPTTIVNLGLYWDLGRVELALDVLNLFDSKDADITYFYESRLAGEPAPVADFHLHPVEPRQVRGALRFAF